MKKIALGLVALAFLALGAVGLYFHYMSSAASDPAFFASEVDAFVEADRASPPEPGQIVFVGSSTIRFWTTLEEDMAPLRVLRRGFGGAHLSHVVHEAPRIVIPYAPRAVVVYAGDNDIGSGKSAEAVVADFEALVALLRAPLPNTDIVFLSIKPSRLRASLWPEMAKANAEIRTMAEMDPRVFYIEVGEVLRNMNDEPNPDYFRFDGLHLNEKGYAVWTSVLKPILLAAYGRQRADRGPIEGR